MERRGEERRGGNHTSRTSPSSFPTNSPDSSQHSSLTSLRILSSSITDSASHSTTTGRVAFGENITDFALREYHDHYKDGDITKKDIFYYIYGLFHHPGYRTKYANNLMRALPRIPMAPDFEKFCEAGQALAWLHLNFETCPRYDLGNPLYSPSGFRKLAFGKTKNTDTGKKESDRTKILIDGNLTFENIPEIKYKVNGRTPLEWIVDRYSITQDKESGIINDPCTGTDIIAVIERAVYVGVESDKRIAVLPKEFEPPEAWTPSKSGLDKFVDATDFQSTL